MLVSCHIGREQGAGGWGQGAAYVPRASADEAGKPIIYYYYSTSWSKSYSRGLSASKS